MPARLAMPAALLVLAACSSPAEVAERTGVEPTASASASSAGAKGKTIAQSTDVFDYELSYPAAVAAIPRLAEYIEGDAEKVRSEMVAEAEQMKADSAKNEFPFNPHSYSADWKVVADIPGYLSLSNEFATYSGGAHGMYGLEGYVWDRKNARGFASGDLFIAPDFLGGTMGSAVCDALNRERKKRRGDEAMSDGIFNDCPSLDEATILVGSAGRKTFDRITIWFGPYVAGPYAEGAYELDFPMTPAMLEAVKPAYRAAFSAGR